MAVWLVLLFIHIAEVSPGLQNKREGVHCLNLTFSSDKMWDNMVLPGKPHLTYSQHAYIMSAHVPFWAGAQQEVQSCMPTTPNTDGAMHEVAPFLSWWVVLWSRSYSCRVQLHGCRPHRRFGSHRRCANSAANLASSAWLPTPSQRSSASVRAIPINSGS